MISSLPRQGVRALAPQLPVMLEPREPGAATSRMKLYNAEWCWYCRRVRERLDELGLDYDVVEVPIRHSQRTEVLEISGQTSVPVLVDGDTVLEDDDVIIPYLEQTYGSKR